MTNEANPGAGQQENDTKLFFELYNYQTTDIFKQKVDNSNAGNLRDCAECHVGGGMNEYVYANMSSASYRPEKRVSLRSYNFGDAVTAWNYFIDIFNPDPAKKGDVVKQDYSQTGVLEMDCLMCHQTGYDWAARKEAVRNGEFDASRAVGAKLVNGVANGTSVYYNYTTVKTNASNQLYVDLSGSLNSKPLASNCSSCHQSQYNVDWKKRGEQWLPGQEVHYSLGCMACHERKDSSVASVGTTGKMSEQKLGLCDPAKGGASDFDAMWNKLDTKEFKHCSDCHESTTAPTWLTYGAPVSTSAHAAKGLTAKIAFDKNGNAASHMDIMDCTACHISKEFDGGAIVDGSGADAEGRVALHDEPQVARDMKGTAGNALYWNNGKLYGANLLTSSFLRDMNGMDTANGGVDGNNDGRNAGMDTLLQTHINDLNIAHNAKALTMEKNADGSWVNETEVGNLMARISGKDAAGNPVTPNLKTMLGIDQTSVVIPKMSFLMVPFKASHNIAPTMKMAWGKGGCTDCHGANKGFYNGAYPILGNMSGVDNNGKNKFRFKSNQVTAFTKVNGLADVTDSHPSVVTKKGDRTVPIKLLSSFDNAYVANEAAQPNQTLVAIDRSQVIYEDTFQTRDTAWYSSITGSAPAAACNSASPFFCATPLTDAQVTDGTLTQQNAMKSKATSTKGWLLKVEIQDATAPGGVRFRTAQLGKDNAGSMAEVVAALPAGFTSNTDFTVTESGGALTIAGVGTTQIRISPQTDSAPYGLKSKVYKADAIVRNGVNATGRVQFVNYLDGLNTDPAAYGIGIKPVAAIGPVTDDSSLSTGVQWVQNVDHTVSAAFAQPNAGKTADIGTVKYLWSTTASDVTIGDANAKSTTFKFATPGSKTIKLTVTDEEGQSSVSYLQVEAIVAPMTIAWANSGTRTGTATFSNYPGTTTKIVVNWGDGLTTTRSGAYLPTNDLAIAHTYSTATSKTIKMYCYNSAGAQVGYMAQTITP